MKSIGFPTPIIIKFGKQYELAVRIKKEMKIGYIYINIKDIFFFLL